MLYRHVASPDVMLAAGSSAAGDAAVPRMFKTSLRSALSQTVPA